MEALAFFGWVHPVLFPVHCSMRLIIPLLFAALIFAPSCRDRDDEKKKPTKRKGPVIPAEKRDPSKEVEAFTGAHTRMVWAECLKPGEADTFAVSDGLILRGLDTRDGKGERAIFTKPGNYSRPILTCDGTGILFTDKNTARKGGKKHYRPLTYRTDWKGTKPVRLAEGYAVDCWKDPATGTEWVYAVQDFKPTKGVSLEGHRLVRFPLKDPGRVETVYDETPITPDNIQFSRDGTQASGLFPWPHAGMLTLQDGKWSAEQLTIGCWTSHSPDNSGVLWAFDGDHKKVHMFAGEKSRHWLLSFAEAPNAKGREMYHPRWSNHPQFVVMTGPYTKQKGQDGSVINKGGATAQVMLARLSAKADKVEGWLQVSSDKSGESYPDAWIEGGDSANLEGFTIGRQKKPVLAGEWPAKTDGLLFLWRDRVALNTFTRRDGKKSEARIEGRAAGRYGRFNEMQLDGGTFEAEAESAEIMVPPLKEKPQAAFEAVLLPGEATVDGKAGGEPFLFTAPGFSVIVKSGSITVARASGGVWASSGALPRKPFHLVVNRLEDAAKGFEVFVDGRPLAMAAVGGATLQPGPEMTTVAFGGGWNGGLLNVAIYDRTLDAGEIARGSQAMQQRIAALPPAPPRVKLQGKLVEVSAMPTPEGIEPYTSALVEYVYEVEKVLEGEFKDKRVLVKHWAMLDAVPVEGLPREVGKSYELTLERGKDHEHLQGERVMQDTTAFDLEPWFDVGPPRVGK
jgi:hypothetical protein